MSPAASPPSSSTMDISLDSSQFYVKYQGVSTPPLSLLSFSLSLGVLSPPPLVKIHSFLQACLKSQFLKSDPPGGSQPARLCALLGPLTLHGVICTRSLWASRLSMCLPFSSIIDSFLCASATSPCISSNSPPNVAQLVNLNNSRWNSQSTTLADENRHKCQA